MAGEPGGGCSVAVIDSTSKWGHMLSVTSSPQAQLDLELTDQGFHEGVVVGIAHSAGRGSDLLECEVLVKRSDVY